MEVSGQSTSSLALSTPELNPHPQLALTALAHKMDLNKDQLLQLRDECILLTCTAQQTVNFSISRNLFRIAAIDVLGDAEDGMDHDNENGGPEYRHSSPTSSLSSSSSNASSMTPDVDILDQLFTLWDPNGEDKVDYRAFLTGVSPLASSAHDALSTVLRFALQLNDLNKTQRVDASKLLFILSCE